MRNTMQTKWLHNPQESDRTLYYCQQDGVSVEHMIRPASFNMRCNHFHSEYEIYLLVRGRRRFFLGNRSYLVGAGSLVLIGSGLIHMTHSVPDDPDTSYERIILYLSREKVEEFDRKFPELEMGSFLQQSGGVYVLPEKEKEATMQMFELLMGELQGGHKKRHTLIDLEVIRFFINFWRGNRPVSYLKDKDETQKTGKYAVAYAASDYISAHYCEQITLEQLAGEFYVSKSYLSRSFKEVVGFGIREYINLLRIREAQELLGNSDLTVSAISEAVGFDNVSYFGQVFQKHMAISPSQYRRELSDRKKQDV